MSTFVLVHGSFHGSWAWEKVIPLLEEQGHRAIAIDLPGHGRDEAPLAAQTLRSYVDAVCRVLDAQPEPVVLVGHSMGGVVVTQTAEERPEKIRALGYVCAFLPRDGESLLAIAKTDAASLLVQNLVIDEPAGLHWVLEDGIVPALCHDCTDADAASVRRRVVREPIAPVATPVHVTPERFGRVPRTYVVCTEDRALSPEIQRRMIDASPCQRVLSLATSHSPMFAAPRDLAAHLITL